MDRNTEDADRHPDADPRGPEIVAAVDYETGVIPLARPGVVVWLDDDAPDQEEVDRAAAMRAHPAGGSRPGDDTDRGTATRRTDARSPNLRAVG